MTNLTVTKEKAVELKLAGWMKGTRFYWKISHPDWYLDTTYWPEEKRKGNAIHAPTITELLEEMDNKIIFNYTYHISHLNDLIDLFRSPDKLADCWIFGRKEGLIK